MTKQLILNEFCLTTKYHRKYAIRILNGPPPGKRPTRPERRRGLSYGHELLSILTSVWEGAGYPWSVRLKVLLPAWRRRVQTSSSLAKGAGGPLATRCSSGGRPLPRPGLKRPTTVWR